jgi:hypothetical protein
VHRAVRCQRAGCRDARGAADREDGDDTLRQVSASCHDGHGHERREAAAVGLHDAVAGVARAPRPPVADAARGRRSRQASVASSTAAVASSRQSPSGFWTRARVKPTTRSTACHSAMAVYEETMQLSEPAVRRPPYGRVMARAARSRRRRPVMAMSPRPAPRPLGRERQRSDGSRLGRRTRRSDVRRLAGAPFPCGEVHNALGANPPSPPEGEPAPRAGDAELGQRLRRRMGSHEWPWTPNLSHPGGGVCVTTAGGTSWSMRSGRIREAARAGHR